MATPFAFDRTCDFAVPPTDLWSTLARTDCYRTWWPWLRELHVDGDGLATGSVARLVIQAPLPYQLHCTLRVLDADPPHRLEAAVTGDLAGPARLELAPGAGGTAARMAWTLEGQSSLLRPLSVLARPALAWAHDRIVERGLDQFEANALAEPSRD
ncbi:MAG: SRPBCC family protein [Acidimicrobiia bacterium]